MAVIRGNGKANFCLGLVACIYVIDPEFDSPTQVLSHSFWPVQFRGVGRSPEVVRPKRVKVAHAQ